MASTDILNHYRHLIVSDKSLLHLLSIIFREGDISEKLLINKSGMGASELKFFLHKLYMSNLAKTEISSQYWICTKLGKELLSTLDINKISSISYVSEQDIPEDEIEFLTAFLRKRSDQNSEWSKNVNVQLRVLNKAFKATSDENLIDESIRTRAMRAILVGSDMSASKLEFDSYSSLLTPEIESIRNKLKAKEKPPSKYNFVKIFRSASEDYNASNRFFTSDESIDDPAVVFICLSRLLANAKEESDVSDFKYIHNLDSNFHKRGLKKIMLEIPEIGEPILQEAFFNLTEKGRTSSLERLKDEMIEKLDKTFEDRNSHFQNIFQQKKYFVDDQSSESSFEYYENAFDQLMDGKYLEFSRMEKRDLFLKTTELKSYMEDKL